LTDGAPLPVMLPIALADLEQAGVARVDQRGVVFEVDPRWCVAGEGRLGFAGIVRLVECVRELHWRQDIAKDFPLIDSITQSLTVEFRRPVAAAATIRGDYRIKDVRSRSYSLLIALRNCVGFEELAVCRLASVFYDSGAQSTVRPPRELADELAALQATERGGWLEDHGLTAP
jgi:acyl-CoA thioesterase FadM